MASWCPCPDSSRCIFHTSSYHSWHWSSGWHVLACIERWRSPSCNILCPILNYRFLSFNLFCATLSSGFLASVLVVSCIGLPSSWLSSSWTMTKNWSHNIPHLAGMTAFERFPAAKFSKLLYIMTILLHYIFRTSDFMWLLGVHVPTLEDATPILHSSIVCTRHKNDTTWFAISTKGLPVAIFSDESWIIKLLLYNILRTANICRFHSFCIEGLPDASSKLHTSIPCLGHHNHLTWLALSTESLPVAVFSHKIYTKISLLYNVFSTSDFMWLFGVHVHCSANTSSILHSSVAGIGHKNHLTWFALCTEGFPVAILSYQTWIKNSYFIISSEHPISWTCFVATSMDSRTHLPYFILP